MTLKLNFSPKVTQVIFFAAHHS